MGAKETALASHTTKDRTQNSDDNIQMHHQHGTKVFKDLISLKNNTWDNM